jgi:transposase
MRDGAEFFTQPVNPAQRRYEAMRAYLVDGMSAAEVADRFGYSTASVHQMATLLRKGQMSFFAEIKPGPKGPRKAGRVRDRVLALRAESKSVTEIADVLAAEGTPVSAQTVWTILDAEGIGRLVRDDEQTQRGTPKRLDPVKARALPAWPAPIRLPCDHAGLLLLLPAMVDLDLPGLVASAGYPGTSAITAWQSIGSLLWAKCGRKARTHHVDALTDDTGLALMLGLTALPKATHLGSYSYRVRREANHKLLAGLVTALRRHGLATGEAGFNCDFHAIRHHGDADLGAPLERHYVPKRSQRTRSVLTFFAQDHASSEMVYANADITKAEQPREIVAFAQYWRETTGADPGLLVFDSQLTNYGVLNELSALGLTWLTLRKRGQSLLDSFAALPASAWTTHRIDRAGQFRAPQMHESIETIKGITNPVRQIAVRNIGHEHPTIMITNAAGTAKAKDLFTRYAQRMTIENELDAYIGGFHLDALTSSVALNVDLDATLTVVAGNLYRMLARQLTRYETATPERIWRHFLDTPGTIDIADDAITVDLNLRTYHPVLIDAGIADLDLPIPWLDNRRLRFRFPPR